MFRVLDGHILVELGEEAITDLNCFVTKYCQSPNLLDDSVFVASFNRDDLNVILPDESGLELSMPDDLTETFEYVPGEGHTFE